jgi:hypothetical protein
LAGTEAAFSSSWTICVLSDAVRVGACRMLASFGSLWKIVDREERDLAVVSRVDVFTAAVY